VATTTQVVACCAGWSLARPFAAALRTGRDQPAPPAAMMGYSVQLAWRTTVTALVLMGMSSSPPAVLMIGGGVTAWSMGRILGSLRNWDDPATRARVVTTVAETT
jgi:hypothetical protein